MDFRNLADLRIMFLVVRIPYLLKSVILLNLSVFSEIHVIIAYFHETLLVICSHFHLLSFFISSEAIYIQLNLGSIKLCQINSAIWKSISKLNHFQCECCVSILLNGWREHQFREVAMLKDEPLSSRQKQLPVWISEEGNCSLWCSTSSILSVYGWLLIRRLVSTFPLEHIHQGVMGLSHVCAFEQDISGFVTLFQSYHQMLLLYA
jgi:hypothetical protein